MDDKQLNNSNNETGCTACRSSRKSIQADGSSSGRVPVVDTRERTPTEGIGV